MKSPKILLPKGYLSWTQFNMFERSPEQYRKQYILGEGGFENNAMRFGKRLADALEGKDDGEDPLITALSSLLPKYKVIEKELEATIGGLKLTGKLDSYKPRAHSFYEYKTGMAKWNQRRVDKHGQLDFYAMLIYLNFNVIPKIKLFWAETERDKETKEIVATGRIEEFERKIALVDILRFMARAKKVAKGISEMYQLEIKKTF